MSVVERRAAATRRRLVLAGSMVIVLVVALVAIIAMLPTLKDDDGAAVLRPDQGPAVLVAEKTDMSRMARLEGPLTDVNGCLGVGTTMVIWKYGTTVQRDPFRVTFEGRTYRLGDTIAVGGGYSDGPMSGDDDLYANAPTSCREQPYFG